MIKKDPKTVTIWKKTEYSLERYESYKEQLSNYEIDNLEERNYLSVHESLVLYLIIRIEIGDK
ncbi:MAG: hypothetical protein NTX05_00440 [Fusobacteria bacterium]|nr:hypothetical protein [Fusobacteriota bacterium]